MAVNLDPLGKTGMAGKNSALGGIFSPAKLNRCLSKIFKIGIELTKTKHASFLDANLISQLCMVFGCGSKNSLFEPSEPFHFGIFLAFSPDS